MILGGAVSGVKLRENQANAGESWAKLPKNEQFAPQSGVD
jgi:hypothetical protein